MPESSGSSGLRPRNPRPLPLAELRPLLPLGAVPEIDDVAVTGITHDSREVRRGDLYVALAGARTHGARFVDAARAAGAAAVLTDEEGAELVRVQGHEAAGELPVLVVHHPRAWLGEVAAAVYGRPADDMLMFGVTGTNGKTTTAYLLESGLRHSGRPAGLIGTVETRVGDEIVRSVRTTPEATDVHALLAVMRERGMRACAMEVSSHALAFGRVDAITFDVAGFTNLSRDHLDFHADLAEYFGTKARLFTPHHAKRAVICVDDEFGRRLSSQVEIPAVTVATKPAAGYADWAVEVRGHDFDLVSADGRVAPLQVPLPGSFNVANAALAVAMLVEAGIDLPTAAAGVAECGGVPGRMEQVRGGGPDAPLAVVDYAHTPDAVQNVLRALRRESAEGRLIVVIGAGGDRDRDKRPAMGEAAAREADVVVVTDDNPRSEDPAVIRAAVLAGTGQVDQEERAEVIEVADRGDAIRAALGIAQGPSDTVVVLGKGHEQGQEIAGIVHPFDDRVVVGRELELRA